MKRDRCEIDALPSGAGDTGDTVVDRNALLVNRNLLEDTSLFVGLERVGLHTVKDGVTTEVARQVDEVGSLFDLDKAVDQYLEDAVEAPENTR